MPAQCLKLKKTTKRRTSRKKKLFIYRPGQEEGNIPYVVDAGFGTYSSDPMEIGNIIREWLMHPNVLRQMQQAAITASRPNATLDIARDIGKMLFEHIKKR
jgi:1,2-diacylglycerol 3-beta-galactosyltransferase